MDNSCQVFDKMTKHIVSNAFKKTKKKHVHVWAEGRTEDKLPVRSCCDDSVTMLWWVTVALKRICSSHHPDC